MLSNKLPPLAPEGVPTVEDIGTITSITVVHGTAVIILYIVAVFVGVDIVVEVVEDVVVVVVVEEEEKVVVVVEELETQVPRPRTNIHILYTKFWFAQGK